MSKKDFSNFKIWCTDIHSLFSIPTGFKPKSSAIKKYQKLINSSAEKSVEDLEYIKSMSEKMDALNDPPISKTTISSIIRQYGRIVYNKKIAAVGSPISFFKKGTDLELEGVDFLSKIDKKSYKLETETTENAYLLGKCDIYCQEQSKIIDTKISWNINSFLKSRTTELDKRYWYQMQGYMELYDVDEAEVVFLLLNTPLELIEKEKIKIINRFIIGEIDREKYEIDIENIESAFTYTNMPMKKRYFKYRIKRDPQIFEKIYKRVEKVREWMQQFDKEMNKNIIVVPSLKYLETEKNNTEFNPTESGQVD